MLAFVPNSQSSGVECTMHKHSLVRNTPQYAALSYCWGDENDRRDIIVNNQTVTVTASLEKALRHLRTSLGEVAFAWADALCINQGDKQERNLQVRLMTQIYQKAQTVFAWLGEPSNASDARSVVPAIKALAQSSIQVRGHVADSAISSSCTGLLMLLNCPLWQRRWIIQELTAASNVKILYDEAKISWHELTKAYAICSVSRFWLPEHVVSATSYRQISDL